MGSNFDLKEFFDEFQKVMSEFEKRIDPDLPFFYWTGHQTRYRAFALPSFNEPSAGGVERLDKVRFSRRETLGYLLPIGHPPSKESTDSKALVKRRVIVDDS